MDDLVRRLSSIADILADLFPEFSKDINAAADRIEELEAALRVAAGYISTKEGHTDQHPQDVYDWIFRAALGEKT